MSTTQERVITLFSEKQLAKIQSDDNIRFGLIPGRIATLAEEIKREGRVLNPLQLADLGGGEFLLESGHYRKAAVELLHSQGIHIPLPVEVTEAKEETARIMSQVGENFGRQEMTPMDSAIAIDKLFKAGVARAKIREIFTRPGGKKGEKMEPASNAWVNMVHSFLKFPAKIKNAIHIGQIGVGAAYELGKFPADKWGEIFDKAVSARQTEIAKENADEEKFLTKEQRAEDEARKVKDAEEKEAAAKLEAEKAKADAEAAAVKAKDAKAIAAKAATQKFEGDKKDRKNLEATAKAADIAANEAMKAKESAEKKAEAAQKKLDAVAKVNAERAAKLKDARDAAAKKPTTKAGDAKTAAVGTGDIREGARQAGTSASNTVPLKASEIRKVVTELQIAGCPDNVRAIGKALQSCFDGITTDTQLLTALAKITGEYKAKTKAAA